MDGGGELREIKKEIIESRGLIIKSNNLTNSLSAEVRGIAKRQTAYERRLAWTSVGAYVIFVVLIFAAVQLVYNQRQAALEGAIKTEKDKSEAAEKKLASMKQERRGDDKSRDEKLLALYSLIHERDRQAALDAFDALDRATLTPLETKLLGDAVAGFRSDLSMEHYSRGLDLMGESKYGEAVEELRAALRFKDDAGHTTAAKIQMANALRLQGKPREAIAVLQRLLEEHLDRELSDDALWYLALSHEDAHQKDEARSVLRALMRQYPDSQYYRLAKVRAAELQLRLFNQAE